MSTAGDKHPASEPAVAAPLEPLREPPRWTRRLIDTASRIWPEGRRARIAVGTLLGLVLVAMITLAHRVPATAFMNPASSSV